jgi:hypothetical protein
MKSELMKIEGAMSYGESFVKFQIGGRTLTVDCTDGFSYIDGLQLTSGASTRDMVHLITLILRNND